jgi:ATP-binding cassette subfamily C protein
MRESKTDKTMKGSKSKEPPANTNYFQLFRILSKRQRVILFFSIIFQSLVSLLDFVGVALLGIVVYIFASADNQNSSNKLSTLLSRYHLLNQQDLGSSLFKIVVFAFVLFILKGIFAPFLFRRIFKSISRMTSDLALQSFDLLLGGKLDWIKNQNLQRLLFNFGDGINNSVGLGLSSFVLLTSEASLLVIFILSMSVINPWMSFVIIAYFTAILLFLHSYMNKNQERHTRYRIENLLTAANLIGTATAIFREIATSHTAKYYRNRYSVARSQETNAVAELQYLNLIPKYAMDTAFMSGIFLLCLYYLKTGLNSPATISSLVFFIGASSRMLPSILRVQSALSGFSNARSTLNETISMVTSLTENLESPISLKGYIPTNTELNLVIDDLKFQHGGERPFTLQVDHLRLNQGDSLAVVGKTGSGKSTFMDLLLGFNQPTEGILKFGEWTPQQIIASRPGLMSLVPQNIPILDGNICENIALGTELHLVDQEKLKRVIQFAHLDDFIDRQDAGILTTLFAGGKNLSGGEIQRIGIARALYLEPAILLLDEATRALDSDTENHISEMLLSLRGKVTLITIAHRLSTAKNATKVVFFESGKSITSGTFEEVRQSVADFDRQAKLQGL